VPELRGRLWEELERAQEQLCTICAARSGRDPNDFELRVVAISLLAAAFEATREWVLRGGRGSMVDLVNQAFDAVQANARLDALASPVDLTSVPKGRRRAPTSRPR
jgi:hypothetical protein